MMVEVDPASLVVLSSSPPLTPGMPGTPGPAAAGAEPSDSLVTITGEIVDSKCFLGVMVPGSGKTHKECASLCLRGGIPPAVYVRDEAGRSALLLLTGKEGEPVGSQALQVAGEAIKERAKRLRATGELALQKRLASEVGSVRQVLIESPTQGRTEHFIPVAVAGDAPGAVRALKIAGHDGAGLTV